MTTPSTGRRALVALTALTLLVASLTSCSSGNRVATVGYAVDNVITTYNAGTRSGATSAAQQALGRVLTGFSYLGPDGNPLTDTDVGTATLAPGPVLTVAYRFSDAAVWSDGVAMACDDLVLAWASRSGRFTRTDGAPVFDAADTAGYSDIDGIDCAAGSKDALVRFRPDRAFTHWRALFSATEMMPAHVAARAAGLPDVVAAIVAADPVVLSRLGDVWNAGWNISPGDLDQATFVSSGPYRVQSYSANQGLVLVANDRWWGRPPETRRIVIWPRGIDVAARAAAGDIQVIDADGGSSLPDGFSGRTVPGWGIEQLVFATAGTFADPAVRRGFASCVPRDLLYANFGHPGYDAVAGRGAGVVDSRFGLPGTLAYPALAGPGAGRYRVPDVPTATAEVGSRPVTVRIGYLGDNERRAGMVAAIASACAPAGITVVDAAASDFAPFSLGVGVDAVLTATAARPGLSGSDLAVAARYALRAGQGTNLGRYSNPRVDAIIDQLAIDSSDGTLLGAGVEAESLMWSDVPTLPLFNVPRLVGAAGGMAAVVTNVTSAGAGWNMDRWSLVE